MTRFVVAAVVSVATLLGAPGPVLGHGTGQSIEYQLALGDSLPYGFTTAKALAGAPPGAFHGFVDLLGRRLDRARPGRLRTVNYSCPGETTSTFVTGPCDWTATGHQLHDAYTGPQLVAAETFLRSHRGHVALVTITLWGNDVRAFLESCPDVACVVARAPGEIAAFAARLSAGLERLRAAAPEARIVVVGAFHVRLDLLEFADQLIAAFNAAIEAVTRAAQARFADPTSAFNPAGDVATRTAALCRLTLLCTANDSHPSPAGHRALADLIWKALR